MARTDRPHEDLKPLKPGKPPRVEPKSLVLPPRPRRPLPPDFVGGSVGGFVDMGQAFDRLTRTTRETTASLEQVVDNLAKAVSPDIPTPIQRWALDLWDAIKDLDPDDEEAIGAAIDARMHILPAKYRQDD